MSVSSFCFCLDRELLFLLDRVKLGTFSAATSGMPMDIDKEQDDAETVDAATSQAGTASQPCSYFANCSDVRLNSDGRVFL